MFANSKAQLLLMIQAKIDSALISHVAPLVENKIKAHISSDVYSFPTNLPSERRGANDGLMADKNIVSSLVGIGKLMTMNVAEAGESLIDASGLPFQPDSRTTFSRWINDGEWMDLGEWGRSGNKTKRAARPFITNTQEELNSNKLEWLTALKIGMMSK